MSAAARELAAPEVRPEREWVIAAAHPDVERLSRAAHVDLLLAQLLLNRDVTTADACSAFLSPRLADLQPAARLPNAERAAERLLAARRSGKRIVIYGDYDVDGITATTILWHVLTLAGAQVDYYIPSRLDEGYGVNGDALEQIAAGGAGVVVTVDCGVTAIDEAERARQLGLELIITDHHEPAATLPDALIVHPTACGESPNPNLSGAGVALKVAWAIAQQAGGAARVSSEFRDALVDATALAALGLVADVVPLVGENRIIASFGLRQLQKTRNNGLRALIDVAGLAGKRSYDEYDVGFRLAPRLNAIGRMGHAREAVELFTRADEARAKEIASELDRHNRERQGVEREIVDQAIEMVRARGFDRDGCRGIVLASENWHAGVIGIVASRLVDRFGRPTVLIALENGAGQGSGRSIPHFPLHEVLNACDEHLISHGGHAMAAGVKVAADKVDAFTHAFQAEAAQRLTSRDLVRKLRIDDEISLAQMTPELIDAVRLMQPFGAGNPRPMLASGPLELAEPPRAVGATGAHLSFTAREGSTYRRAIAFGRGARLQELAERGPFRLAFEPIINEWNGRRKVELKVTDWQFV